MGSGSTVTPLLFVILGSTAVFGVPPAPSTFGTLRETPRRSPIVAARAGATSELGELDPVGSELVIRGLSTDGLPFVHAAVLNILARTNKLAQRAAIAHVTDEGANVAAEAEVRLKNFKGARLATIAGHTRNVTSRAATTSKERTS